MKKKSYFTIRWENESVVLLDQRLLPGKERYKTYKSYKDVVKAIKTMEVRGAPAIGVAAALGIALGASKLKNNDKNFEKKFFNILDEFGESRPTAVNLFWAIDRMFRTYIQNWLKPKSVIKKLLIRRAKSILKDDININKKLSHYGQKLIKNGQTVLTHCNAGPLATAGIGTALGVIITANKKGKKIKVFVDETRPRLQGARLTAWELMKNKVNATLISDNMAASLMKDGKINIIITGADRIAKNGDTANKIGTYNLAVLAKYHKIPFYIAAPISTIDMHCPNGNEIPIEERSGNEITNIGKERIAPKGIKTFNPAFDVTPAKLIKGIITERGVLKPPYGKTIGKLLDE